MARENFGLWLFLVASLQFFLRTQCINVGITYVQEAGIKGGGKKLEHLEITFSFIIGFVICEQPCSLFGWKSSSVSFQRRVRRWDR